MKTARVPAAANPGRAVLGLARRRLSESARVKTRLGSTHRRQFVRAAGLIADAVRGGRFFFFFGNGGSAADAQHLAAEFVGRFARERRALPAVALTTDSSALTSIGNDYGFDRVFARQVEGLVRRGDVVFALSTSGRSPSVLEGIRAARRAGAAVIGFTGAKGKGMAAECDVAFVVPSADTPRIQECHITVGHILCEIADACA